MEQEPRAQGAMPQDSGAADTTPAAPQAPRKRKKPGADAPAGKAPRPRGKPDAAAPAQAARSVRARKPAKADGATKAARGAAYLIANRSDRLGARIIAILNTLRIGRSFDIDCRIHWHRTGELAEPSELFSEDFIDRYFISKADFVAHRTNGAPLPTFSEDRDIDRLRQTIAGGTSVIVDTIFGIYTLAFEDKDAARAGFLQELDAITFNPVVATWMTFLRGALANPEVPTTAYHIRRGDLTADIQAKNRPWPNKFVPDEFFEAHMERRMADAGPTILFSDNRDVLDRYTSRYPALRTFRDVVDTQGLTQAQIDFLELYAMSCCELIIAPPESAFSSTASTIGQTRFTDVESDLQPEDRLRALETLCYNLRNRPETYANDGEIGQYLVYADKFLADSGRVAEANSLLTQHVEQGLALSHIYARLFKRLFDAGEYGEILRMRGFVDENYVYFLRSFAQVELYHGCALMMLGRKDEALRHIATAFWHEPIEGEINVLCSILLQQGAFNETNFWFSDEAITRYLDNSWAQRFVSSYYQTLVDAGHLEVPRKISTTRALVWEWDAFTRAHSNAHFRYVGHFKNMIRLFETRQWHDYEQPNADSFHALVRLRQGDVDVARTLAQKAVTARPDVAIFHKRLSDALLAAHDHESAATVLAEAIRLRPKAAMLHAQMGHILQAAGDQHGAARAYATALEGDRICFPPVYFAAADAFLAIKDPDRAIGLLDTGLRLTPQDWRRQVQYAQLLQKAGRDAEACAAIGRTYRWAPHRPPVTLLYSDLLDATGQPERAVQVLRDAAAQTPDKPQFAKALNKRLRG